MQSFARQSQLHPTNPYDRQATRTDADELRDTNTRNGGIIHGHESTAALARHDSVTDYTFSLFSDPVWSENVLPATKLNCSGHAPGLRCPYLTPSQISFTQLSLSDAFYAGNMISLPQRNRESQTRTPSPRNHSSRRDGFLLPPNAVTSQTSTLEHIFDVLTHHRPLMFMPEVAPAYIQRTQFAPNVVSPPLHTPQEEGDVIMGEDPPLYKTDVISNAILPPAHELYDTSSFFSNARVPPPAPRPELRINERHHNTTTAQAIRDSRQHKSASTPRRPKNSLLGGLGRIKKKAKNMQEKRKEKKAKQKIAWLEKHDFVSL